MNFFPCALRSREGSLRLESSWFTLTLDGSQRLTTSCGDVLLGVRPHDLQLADPAGADATARVDVIQPLGSEALVHVRLTGKTEEKDVTMVLPAETKVGVDDEVGVRFPPDRLHVFDAGDGCRLN
jgi:ABC-type sugar transport system ATPase subunit